MVLKRKLGEVEEVAEDAVERPRKRRVNGLFGVRAPVCRLSPGTTSSFYLSFESCAHRKLS